MSKITLEPNDSGAGTFSIVSPDSNTNRTLTLPDEAGTILSDASTIDSNNLQSDVYKQDNILGTVSQSGGVPTGAIIERGSNSNGEFVKFADGTLITYFREFIGTIQAQSEARETYTFPAAFSEPPTVQFTMRTNRDVPSVMAEVAYYLRETPGTTSTKWIIINNGSLSLGFVNVFLTAIGRWY